MTDDGADRDTGDEPGTRVVRTLATGTKLFLVAALLFVVVGVYLLLVPISVQAKEGTNFDCGNVVTGPSNNFAKGICGNSSDRYAARAYAAFAAALIIGAGGFVTFGMVERRQQPRRDGDDKGSS